MPTLGTLWVFNDLLFWNFGSEYSTQLNASRLKLLQAQDDLVRKMKEAAEKQLQMVGSSDNEDYPKLLEALIIQVCDSQSFDNVIGYSTRVLFQHCYILKRMAYMCWSPWHICVQGLLRLKEHSTQLRCREQDLEIVQSVIGSTKQAYAEKLNVDVPEVFVDEEHFLPGPPGSSNHGSSWYQSLPFIRILAEWYCVNSDYMNVLSTLEHGNFDHTNSWTCVFNRSFIILVGANCPHAMRDACWPIASGLSLSFWRW